MFRLEVADRIATLVLDRPPVNALNAEWTLLFHAELDALEARDDWAVLHLRSALRLFSAGADLKDMREAFATADPVPALVEAILGYQRLFARLEALPRVTLAEIGGAAMGGGLELALACDLRIVAREARVGLPELALGLLPAAGGTQRLTRLCGRAVAARLILGAATVDGAEAERLGLAQWSTPLAELPAAAAEIARRYAAIPAHAVARAKLCLAAAGDPARDGFELELEGSEALLASSETRALVRQFLERKVK
jgi:enoyl-CoA hydratase